VLIVEDEYLLAHDLSRYFREMGAVVLGPASSLDAAGPQVAYADAAILDIDLNGQAVFPLADELVRRGIPFVFYTGRSDIVIPHRFQFAGRVGKPASTQAVFDALFPPRSVETEAVPDYDDVVGTLPRLRLAARLLMRDGGSADRLVELTLERALEGIAQRDPSKNLESWLTELLKDTYAQAGRKLHI